MIVFSAFFGLPGVEPLGSYIRMMLEVVSKCRNLERRIFRIGPTSDWSRAAFTSSATAHTSMISSLFLESAVVLLSSRMYMSFIVVCRFVRGRFDMDEKMVSNFPP